MIYLFLIMVRVYNLCMPIYSVCFKGGQKTTMRILCANVGSTSFKYQIIDIETAKSAVGNLAVSTTSLVKGGVGTHR